MVKGTKKSKSKSKSGPKKKGINVSGRRRPARPMFLDSAALKHRQLLLDPCNAEMSNGCLAGLGTGQYRRFRSILASDGASVEGTYVFQLGTGLVYNGTHVAGTAGTAYTFGTASNVFQPQLNTSTNLRCLAGCIKVRYLGAESARAGTIGMAVVPGQYLAPGSSSTAVGDLARTPFNARFGEVVHEVKFAPAQADEEFHNALTLEPKCTSIVITYRGIPASSLQFEITACYEIEDTTLVVPLASHTPQSRNTLNHVLQSLGPVSSWAYSHVVAPTIRSMATGLLSSPITGKYASAVAAGIMAI